MQPLLKPLQRLPKLQQPNNPVRWQQEIIQWLVGLLIPRPAPLPPRRVRNRATRGRRIMS
jgi:hypothetical protein